MDQPTTPNILIIDDDRRLTISLSELFESEGYGCSVAPNGASGLILAAEQKPDLIILDVMMPGDDGVETLRKIREISNVPVLMLTALHGDEDRVKGLEAGADDYLAKPFLSRELLLRVNAILRRTSTADTRQDVRADVNIGTLSVNVDKQRATLGDQPLDLTHAELRILFALADKIGAVVTREYLSRYALGRELMPGDRTLDTHVSNLRRKISEKPDSSCSILTVRGSGYRLSLD
ncbi:MAG: response regulator transcription factor [Pseudomonadota bacterium]